MTDTSKYVEGRTGPWEIVLGLEVHAQVASKAKLFSGAAVGFGAGPNEQVSLVDAAYWMKGCSSLGRLRFAVLLGVRNGKGKGKRHQDFCLMDIKEASAAAAPRAKKIKMPKDDAIRVVEGARHPNSRLTHLAF